MIVRDFDRQSVLSPAEVGRIVEGLPDAHLKGLQCILFKPMWELRQLGVDVSSGCRGAFYPEYRSIIIHDLEDRKMAKHIILHEIGHYVFHAIIGSYLKKEWVTEIFPRSRFVTQYASRNSGEDFAESYAVYASDPKVLSRISRKYYFMKNKVF